MARSRLAPLLQACGGNAAGGSLPLAAAARAAVIGGNPRRLRAGERVRDEFTFAIPEGARSLAGAVAACAAPTGVRWQRGGWIAVARGSGREREKKKPAILRLPAFRCWRARKDSNLRPPSS